jgi:hypothetical protein
MNAISINGTNIAVRHFRLGAAPDGTRFRLGIDVGVAANNATVEDVKIESATALAGVRVGGENTCLRGVSVVGAGRSNPGQEIDGFFVAANASGTLDFRGATAMNNSGDGFSITNEDIVQLDRVQFLNSMSVANYADGFDVAGPLVELLCSQALDAGRLPGGTPTPGTPTPTADTGRGVIMFGIPTPTGTPGTPIPATLHLENCTINGSLKLGIAAGNILQTTTNILNCTLYENNGKGANFQIREGKTVNIFNTISVADVMLGEAGSVNCSNNQYSGRPGQCRGEGDVDKPPLFADSSHTRLDPDSRGVNEGVDLSDPASEFGFSSRICG